MKNSLETRLGIFVLLAALAFALILEMVGGIDRLTSGKHLNALFANVQELKVGDRVKMAGVEIGRVEEIQLADHQVKVTMKVKKNAEVKVNSKATIKFTGLMGQNFVSVDFGTADANKAEDGAILESEEQADLSKIMTRLDNVA